VHDGSNTQPRGLPKHNLPELISQHNNNTYTLA
jgi:hypothetical protein